MFRRPYLILVIVIFFGGMAVAEAHDRLVIENEGWELVADLYLPEGAAPRAVALNFNKAGDSRHQYNSFARKLSAAGFAVLNVDLRGHGDSTNIDVFDYQVRKNNEILEGSYRDIEAARQFVLDDSRFGDLPMAVVSGSYSGEHAALAGREYGYADAYIQLSPGSFSDASIAEIDPSGVPWLFVRAENERPFFPGLFAAIDEGSDTAEIIVLEGEGHASRLLNPRPEFQQRLVNWLKEKLLAGS